jgi:hypothetical protein
VSDKIEKDHANYGRGTKTAHCSVCEHYHEGSCDIVKGFIDPSYWCQHFKARK